MHPGLIWTEDQAESSLQHDLNLAYSQLCTLSPVVASCSPGKQAALCDFVYNLGSGKYQNSSLRSAVQSEDWPEVRVQLSSWNHVAGQVSEGLTRRRNAEIALVD